MSYHDDRHGTPEDDVATFDPIMAAVLANRFEAIVREMTNTLFRTGRSSVLNMARDFSCCIVTADDQLLAAAEGLQVHVLGAGLQSASMRELHPDMADGDVFLHNDPYMGNTHTADHTLLAPVFAEGVHLFTVSAKAHQADCGNSQPTTYMPFAADLYEEGGLNFPCVRIQHRYEDVADVVRMCRRRIRVPDVWYGDYLASLGAVRIGQRRIEELIAEHGAEVLQQFQDWWLDYSEKRMVQAIKEMPAATLSAESVHDRLPDLPEGVTVRVGVDIRPEDGCVVVDLSDNIDCVSAGINLSESCARAGAVIGVLNCIAADVPRNAGSFRRIDVEIRPGSITGGLQFPFSSSLSTTNILNRLINAVQLAFADLGDGYGLAEGAGAMGVGWAVYSGIDQRTGSAYVNQAVIGNNGGPGGPHCDGWVTYAMPDCAKVVYIDSVELLEQRYPLHFESLRLLTDSGGAGRFRGGPASEVVYGPVNGEMQVFYSADFAENPPKGVLSGMDGRGASAEVVRRGVRSDLPPMGDVTLQVGDQVRGVEAGGGGYGDPLDREASSVLRDVTERWVSVEAAQSVYGVVFRGSLREGTLAVDTERSRELRQRIRREQDTVANGTSSTKAGSRA